MSRTSRIEVVPYNPEWPIQFEHESKKIRDALGECCVEIHHVGSTSVPGLAAKPRIDIIVVINDTAEIIEKIESIGYQYKGEFNIPFHFGFSKRIEPQVNLHVYEVGNPEIELNLLFRDYLRSHPKYRDEYQKLKFDLLKDEVAHEKKNSMFRGYTLGKDEFIKEILEKAGFNRICIRFACHHQEWEKIKSMRQEYFYDKGITDPYDWSGEHKTNLHFLLYKGTEIIGYAHIELQQQKKAFLRVFIIDQKFKTDDVKKQFMDLCLLWLDRQGIHILDYDENTLKT